MSKTSKIILSITFIFIVICGGILLFLDWSKGVMTVKPNGPYWSTTSVKQAKNEIVWLCTYSSFKPKYYSNDKKEFFLIEAVWLERNENDPKIYWSEANYKNILNIYFKELSANDLHKFRLIPNNPLFINEYEKIEHPDGYPRVRFLLNEVPDSIKIEVIERNPSDSLAWTTEEVIDTILFVKKL